MGAISAWLTVRWVISLPLNLPSPCVDSMYALSGRLVAETRLVVERTTPHAPRNLRLKMGLFSAHLRWDPAYDGGAPQSYLLWYRRDSESTWLTVSE